MPRKQTTDGIASKAVIVFFYGGGGLSGANSSEADTTGCDNAVFDGWDVFYGQDEGIGQSKAAFFRKVLMHIQKVFYKMS